MQADVLAYLVENPSAQDTFEGIVEWWLLDRHVAHEAAAVQEVLEDLTARGFVLQRRTADGRTYYRINRERHEEIQTVLDRTGRKGHGKVRS
jgi:hypothetical protein